MDRATPSWRPWFGLGLALIGLNLALGFHNLWPTPFVTTRYELSVEIAGLVLLLALFSGLGRLSYPRLVGWLALLVVIFVLGRYLEVTAPALYGRRINLYWDAQHLPRVAAMLLDALPAWQIWLLGGGIVALMAFLYLLSRALLTMLTGALAHAPPRRFSIALGGALVTLYAAGYLHPQIKTLHWFSLPVSATYAQQAGFVYQAIAGDMMLAADAQPLPDSSLAGLDGADVLILFFESYGVTTLDREEFARALADARHALAVAVEQTGRQVMSARVRSPTFGGASWLAHSTFLSGIEVTDNQRYQRLLTTRRDTLVQRFARQGYRTVGLMPGLRRAWPEGSFYGYDHIYDATSLSYSGPAFGWWRIPDQYALAWLDSLELATSDQGPVMVVMNSITSHAPFYPVPPYQPDWHALLGPNAYELHSGERKAGAHHRGTDIGDDYVAAVEYVLTYLTGYLRHRARDELVLIIIGDHQPPARVSGPDASWEVPVHVIARNRSLLEALGAEGFVAGLEPAPINTGAMHELAAALLRALDTDVLMDDAVTAPAGRLTGSAHESRVDVAGSGHQW